MPGIFKDISFFVVAHQDDWQLFYGQQAFSDLKEADSRVVFIYTTAGDAGKTGGWWQARERGALASQALALGLDPPQHPGTIEINNHPIAIYDAGSFVSYHMRLPDGNVKGNGFESTGSVSLDKLLIGCIPRITALDLSATYTSWGDFCTTLGAIIERERAQSGVAHPWVNAADWSWHCSPQDHSDHKATANALRNMFCQRGMIFNRLWFVTYSTGNRPANLAGDALRQKESVWLAYKQKVEAIADADFLRWEWEQWGAKSYHRPVPASQEDIDPCD